MALAFHKGGTITICDELYSQFTRKFYIHTGKFGMFGYTNSSDAGKFVAIGDPVTTGKGTDIVGSCLVDGVTYNYVTCYFTPMYYDAAAYRWTELKSVRSTRFNRFNVLFPVGKMKVNESLGHFAIQSAYVGFEFPEADGGGIEYHQVPGGQIAIPLGNLYGSIGPEFG